jgi:prolyl 4-hydroxylase
MADAEPKVEIVPISAIRGWSVAINRIIPLMPKAVEALESCLNDSRTGTQTLDLEAIRKNCIFTYVDSYHNTRIQEASQEKRIIKLVHRLLTNRFADKGWLGEEIDRLDLADRFSPSTYTSLAQARSELNPDTDPICFIKGRYGTAGEQVQCVRTADLAQISLPEHTIIQRSVRNLWLYNHRKMVIRFYLLTHKHTVWVGKDAFAIIHGQPYDPDSTDYDVQVRHAGYMAADSKIKLLPFQQLSDDGPDWAQAIKELSTGISPLFRNLSLACDRDSYALFGIDAIPTQEGKLQMIEINNYPNMQHTAAVNEQVNIPCIASLMALTLTGLNNGFWTPIATIADG